MLGEYEPIIDTLNETSDRVREEVKAMDRAIDIIRKHDTDTYSDIFTLKKNIEDTLMDMKRVCVLFSQDNKSSMKHFSEDNKNAMETISQDNINAMGRFSQDNTNSMERISQDNIRSIERISQDNINSMERIKAAEEKACDTIDKGIKVIGIGLIGLHCLLISILASNVWFS